jgi:mycothiol synthase
LNRYFPNSQGAAIGAFDPEEYLVACAAVYIDDDPVVHRAAIVGQVRPDLRGRGIGAYLMRWSQAQARSLLPAATGNQWVLQVRTESLTESAHRLYSAHGFGIVFESLVMRRDLLLPLPDSAFPQDMMITTWQPSLAEQFFQAYETAFRDRPGFPGLSASEWIDQVTGDDLIPEWSLLALASGEALGFVIGTIDLSTLPPGGYVWQIGVIPALRRRGLGSALLVEAIRRMQAAGVPAVQLTVHADNPGAIQAYARLGFTTVGRRARYERVAG